MKIFIHTPGDYSVGQDGYYGTLDLPQMNPDWFNDQEDRENTRGILVDAFTLMFDQRAQVRFEDEQEDEA